MKGVFKISVEGRRIDGEIIADVLSKFYVDHPLIVVEEVDDEKPIAEAAINIKVDTSGLERAIELIEKLLQLRDGLAKPTPYHIGSGGGHSPTSATTYTIHSSDGDILVWDD